MKARLLLAVFLVDCGCAAITRVPLEPRVLRRRDDGLVTLIGAVHVHSFRSHDCAGTDAEIEAAAHLAGLDFVLLTDHRTSATGLDQPGREWQKDDGALFLPGYEINHAGGSLLAIATPAPFDPHGAAGDVALRAHAAGAVLGLGHLEEIADPGDLRVDVAEIFNLHAAARDAGRLGMILGALFLPAAWLMDHLTTLDQRAIAMAERPTLPRAVVFGCDAHANIRILWGVLGTIGSYDDVFRSVTTHVLVRDRSKAALLEALRLGCCYGVFARQGDAQGFEFHAARGAERGDGRRAGERSARAGDAERAAAAGRRDLPYPRRCGGGGQRRPRALVRDQRAGRYRIRALRDRRPWIVSSAIDLTRAKLGAPH
ncbi:MAG: PHP domain-containing protein [Planctomycetota bacterium]